VPILVAFFATRVGSWYAAADVNLA
jgi:hypothetical protein